jgi:DNA-binding MarR family transcriptional regulator
MVCLDCLLDHFLTKEHKMTISETNRQLIQVLEAVHASQDGDKEQFVAPSDLLTRLPFDQSTIEDLFDILEEKNWVKSAGYLGSENLVKLTPAGRQILRDPQYGSASMGTQVFNINAPQSIMNIQSTMSNVTQMINAAPAIEQFTKDQLLQLVQELTTELEKAPADAAEDAEALADEAQTVITAATKDKPNKKTIQIRLEGLRTAATNLATVVPSVLPIAIKIADLLK